MAILESKGAKMNAKSNLMWSVLGLKLTNIWNNSVNFEWWEEEGCKGLVEGSNPLKFHKIRHTFRHFFGCASRDSPIFGRWCSWCTFIDTFPMIWCVFCLKKYCKYSIFWNKCPIFMVILSLVLRSYNFTSSSRLRRTTEKSKVKILAILRS